MLSDDDLKAYALRLYERRAEGIFIRVADAQIGDWEPLENQCHANVTTWCQKCSHEKPVRGWIYIDFITQPYLGAPPHVQFISHSVIENEEGELFDITPTSVSTPYPFIRAEESEAEFEKFVEALNAGGVKNLFYYPCEST